MMTYLQQELKRIKDKGFTLVELIAVIVILAIILAITNPLIGNVVRIAQERACILDASMLERAARNYVTVENISVGEGKTLVVNLKTLESTKYVSDIYSPEDRRTKCEGYVNISNVGGSYSYKAYLKCTDVCKTAGYDDSQDISNLEDNLGLQDKNGAKYFSGANPNNWVKFGRLDQSDNYGLLWRIIKIDDDGIKMVYEGRENEGEQPAENGRVVFGTTAGVAFDTAGTNKWENPVSLKAKLNAWLNGVYVDDMAAYATAVNWKIGGIPYEDPTVLSTFLEYEGIDSVNTGGTFRGLTDAPSMIGLSSPSDFISTSSNIECVGSYRETGSGNDCALNNDGSLNNFLFKNKYHWWTMNVRSDTSDKAWTINNIGQIATSFTNSSIISVRPVINIKRDVIYYDGDGSLQNPFVLEEYMVGLSEKPVISLNGSTPVVIREGDIYIEEGATAIDEKDGDISSLIKISSNINVSIPGTYEVGYTVTDSDGNEALPIIREVIVVERDIPVLNLIGSNPTYVTLNHEYIEEGATANDFYQGDITDRIVILGEVNTSLIGVYEITYNVTNDALKKAVEIIRKVIVIPPKPVLTLNGDSNILVDIGDTYEELGATAIDEIDGDISGQIIKTIYLDGEEVTSITGQERGTYQIKYQVTNSVGGSSTVYRTVSVVSVEGPNITFVPDGNDTPKQQNQVVINVEANKHPVALESTKYLWVNSKWRLPVKTTLSEAIKNAFISGDSISSPRGTDYYYLYAIASDTYDNISINKSKAFKIDNYQPSISLIGSYVENILIYNNYIEKGATAYDRYYDGDLTDSIEITSNINPSIAGMYFVTYTVSDSAGNTTTARRTVKVNLSKPQIILNGSSNITLRINSPYTDAGATATDEIDGDLTSAIIVSSNVDTTKAGTYKVEYSVTNSLGVTTRIDRTVTVYIPTPVITIVGSNPYNSRILLPYTDAGATATDEIDGDLTSSIITEGTVNPNVAGSYTIIYTVTNSVGGVTSKSRTVNVTVPNPVITLNGPSYIEIYKNDTYSDQGATATDEIDGDLTSSIITEGTVNPSVGGTYKVTYSVTNSVGGVSSIQRTVKVKVPKPSIVLNGMASIKILKGTTYIDEGATATDEIDGDLTSSIITEGTINPNVVGTYVVTYSVANSLGGTNFVKRSITVTEPLLTLTLNGLVSDFTMWLGEVYNDPGYKAIDEIDGDITSSVRTTTNLNPNIVGTYTVTYTVTSSSGVTKTATRTVRVKPLEGPMITFDPNGKSIYQKSSTTIVNVGENKAPVDASSLKYLWTTTLTTPKEADITNSFIAGSQITTPNGVTGKYYLAILAKDTLGNTSILMSNGFYLDNTAPVITLKGPTVYEVPVDSVYTEPGATVTDIHSQLNSDGLIVTSNVVPGILGTYSVTYTATDNAGNESAPVIRTVVVREVSLVDQIDENTGNEEDPEQWETYVPKYYADYFVGENPNNWIEFGQVSQFDDRPLLWRIVKSDAEGLKIIYEGIKKDDNSTPTENGKIILGTPSFDTNNSNKWESPASLASYLQAWYESIYEPEKSVLVNPINWCIGGVNSPYTIDYFKTGECLDQTTAGGTFIGHTTAKTVVGLINSADYLLTSSDTCDAYNQAICGDNNYLSKGYNYITMNADAANATNVFEVKAAGGLASISANVSSSIRPVINLKRDVLVLSGEGTIELPYKLNTRVPIVDTENPVITITPNDGATYKNSYSAQIMATDAISGLQIGTLKYVWTTSSTAPAESAFVNSYVNGNMVTTPSDANGTYYLWAMARDNKNNLTIKGSGAFKLDTVEPVITITGENPVMSEKDNLYADAGATASDNVDGTVTVAVISEVNPSVVGTYNVTYTAIDSSGNTATAERIVDVQVTTVNAPILALGMTPVKWNGSSWVTTTTSDPTWYSYGQKEWANARTADGSMWVWIPRYIYKIKSGWHTSTNGTISIQFSRDLNDNWNSSVIGTIQTDSTANASNAKWTNHPAFTFGSSDVTGIWVAKFEASGSTSAVASKPNVSSLRSLTPGIMFTAALDMKTNSIYGWGTTGANLDTHMMKNTEWGAVTYLSKSTYGKTNEIWINNSSTYITGCAGNSLLQAPFSGCQNAYNTANGMQASTTGNITGIYDMAGGASERVPAYVNNGTTNIGTYGSPIVGADIKYKDLYIRGTTDTGADNYLSAISKKGDAMYETSSSGLYTNTWLGDNSVMPYSTIPWILRGGTYNYTSTPGIFYFNKDTGVANASMGFRTTLIVSEGPRVIFNPNGNATYSKTAKVSVSVSSLYSPIDIDSLKYVWTTSTTAPAESSIVNSFSSGDMINSPTGLTGDYYLWVIAKDTNNKTIITRSEVFKFDNVAPTLTLLGDNPKNLYLNNSVYSDAGATASDNISGNITARITTTTNLNMNISGTYQVNYSVSDDAGNVATATRQLIVNAETGRFDYTGAAQVFAAPRAATYGITACGAASGVYVGTCVYGEISLTSGEQLYVYVGGKATTKTGGFNGGGTGGTGGTGNYGNGGYGIGGGGATDIRYGGNALENRIIVGAGAGGKGGNGVVWVAGSTAGTGGSGGRGGSNGSAGTKGTKGYGSAGAGGIAGSSTTGIGINGNNGGSNSSTIGGGAGGGGGGGYLGGGGGGGASALYSSASYNNTCGGGGGGGGTNYYGGVTNGSPLGATSSGHGYLLIEIISD